MTSVSIGSVESYIPNFNHGMQELQTWRSRYSKFEYPEKVMINTYYRQLAVDNIWDTLNSAFKSSIWGTKKNLFNEYISAREHISQLYRQSQLEKIRPNLMSLINRGKDVGGLRYTNILGLVNSAKSSNNKSVEELEYSYIFYALANEYLFRWAACGMIGKSKDEAFQIVTELQINTNSMTTYEHALNLLGQFGAGAFLQRKYRPLPNLF